MAELIEPKVLRGFRDFLPEAERVRRRIQRTLEDVFRLYGFVPIDTPALEYSEVLLGKGGGETEKQVYRFTDQGKRDIAMRYDLTVPFARFMAGHLNELPLPFRRYHMGKVWRGENTQRGRYREFMQIDFDIVGVDSASADYEILLLMVRSLQAMGIQEFRIHFSHRGLFNRLLQTLGLAGQSVLILRAVDKLKKIGEAGLRGQLAELGAGDRVDRILAFIRPEGSFEETLSRIAAEIGADSEEVRRLQEIWSCIRESGLESFFFFDPSITRGLDYYTGAVFETFLTRLPQIGSICSGGRYNNLASLYTRESLPGVGASIGLDRLLAALESLDLLPREPAAADLLILYLEEGLLPYYHKLAEEFRQAGIAAEVYPARRKLAAQFNYAQKCGIPWALICGEEEHRRGVVSLKDLRSRESRENLTPQAAAEAVAPPRP
jgi:histidyl-tRNA synthetase